MPKIAYDEVAFRGDTLDRIARAAAICQQYAAQGYTLTLRQLYYQHVARGLIENNQREYKKLGEVVRKGRRAGLIDWDHLEDRTRNLRSLPSWASPADIMRVVASTFKQDLWRGQGAHVEAWIEKDALLGVIEGVCQENDIGHFSCRGYVSESESWGAAMRLLRAYRGDPRRGVAGKSELVILHLGDHDPSGIDMTRDVTERLRDFLRHHDPDAAASLVVERLALNLPQVRQYDPPPNFAKEDDSRYADYVERFATTDCWELDALDPPVIGDLIQVAIDAHRDPDVWDDAIEERDRQRANLRAVSDRWPDVEAFIAQGPSQVR